MSLTVMMSARILLQNILNTSRLKFPSEFSRSRSFHSAEMWIHDSYLFLEKQWSGSQSQTCHRKQTKGWCLEGIHPKVWKYSYFGDLCINWRKHFF